MRILVVDDEPSLRKGLKLGLEQEGYQVQTAEDGEQALLAIDEFHPDLILLDLMLPGIGGMEVCRRVREKSNVPIIMLTARSDDVDKILGLEVGADDYITKPFNIKEVYARVRAVLRRTTREAPREVIASGALRIFPGERRVELSGEEIRLTQKEFDLLLEMALSPGRVFTRDQLLTQVWGFDYYGDSRTVDVHVRRLREKLEPDPANPMYILTSWGKGYYFRR
ncbi:MAG: response regulator transcription factor [Bacillota bacterium]